MSLEYRNYYFGVHIRASNFSETPRWPHGNSQTASWQETASPSHHSQKSYQPMVAMTAATSDRASVCLEPPCNHGNPRLRRDRSTPGPGRVAFASHASKTAMPAGQVCQCAPAHEHHPRLLSQKACELRTSSIALGASQSG